MASNFGMMPQQMQMQQQQQHRQMPPSNANQQVNQIIFHQLNAQTSAQPPLSGWQSELMVQERMTLIVNLVGSLRLASQDQPNFPGIMKLVEIAMKFEKEIFDKSSDNATYKRDINAKLQQLLKKRNENAAGLQQSVQAQAQAQAQAQQVQAQRQMMMNQNGIQGQGPNGMPQQQPQQGFQHLQHQMQASPLPGQQPQQMPTGIPHGTMQQNGAQNQQAQFNMNGMQPQQHPNAPNRQPNNQPPLTVAENHLVNQLAQRMMNETSPENKNQLRALTISKLDPQTVQKYQAQGVDPIMIYFRSQATGRIRQQKAQSMMQGQGQPQAPLAQQPQNMPGTAPAMQQQRSVNMNGQPQRPTSVGGNPEAFNFSNNMELIGQQQQAGVMAQEAGQVVVPASTAQRNATPQPNVLMPGQPPINMNDQRTGPNPNPNTRAQQVQQSQQVFNGQQDRARMQQAAQQQSQQQARANAQAQAQAQQMALQGQPGGMGPGPMPPQQSPAMGTLNTPLRPPSQQMNSTEQTQMIQNTQFGQPLDPRFMQGNPRQMAPGNNINAGINPAMFASMQPEQQQRLQTLPQDKLNEVMAKWSAANGQAGRPPMPANNQVRPGQPGPQPGPFNQQQNLVNQFMLANPGQRPPAALMAGMTPQQQFLIQQHFAQGQNQNPNQNQNQMQQRNPRQNLNPMQQMDNMDVPPNILNNPNMPRGIPPEAKKWGQLKQWASGNPGISQEMGEMMKNMQKMHYQSLLAARNRNQQPGQPIGFPPGAPGPQTGLPMVPPGMSAPVAPMGQNPMHVPNGMTMGPRPSQAEIQIARNHPSGRFAGATDDQIRAVLLRHSSQLVQQQQNIQQRQNQVNQQQPGQMNPQMPQQHRQGVPPGQQNVTPVGPSQHASAQMPQTKPQVSAPSEQTAPTPTTANRPRPQSNTRPAAQNPSPAQPPKTLKRASSDDVVEVPNPNTQQAPRPTPQHTQNQAQAHAQAQAQAQAQNPQHPHLTQQQIASLSPEQRKKYETAMRLALQRQALQANNTSDTAKLREIMQEENSKVQPMSDLPLDMDAKRIITAKLRENATPLNNLSKAIGRWFAITHDEARARAFIRTWYRLTKQFHDHQTLNQIKDTFSITAAEIDQARALFNGMIKDLSDRFPTMKKPDPTQAQSAASQPPTQASQPAETSVPLNAANLQQQQQQLNKIHQRSNSRSSQAPAAPTSSQPPFPFGASSPHGQPLYHPKAPQIPPDALHIPARKKQKHSTPITGQGTPGSLASPQVAKAVSPEIKRQPPPEIKEQPKPSLSCPDIECERHNIGFDSEEELRRHTQEEHVKPLENPLKYVQENLISTLGLDEQGRSKKAPASSSNDSGVTPTAMKMTNSSSKQGHTPNMKAEASTPSGTTSTPMMRHASMNRQGSTAGAKTGAAAKGKLKSESAQEATLQNHANQKDSNRQGSNSAAQEVIMDPWATATIDPHDLFQSFQGFESGAGGAISDMNVYRSITPNDTPESSKDGASEPNSDISEGVGLDISLEMFDDKWHPFGPSDAEALFEMNINMNNFNVNGEEDLMMFEDEQPSYNMNSWDDMADPSVFDKPFTLDTSMYSLDAN